jgi:hypothetical protein
MKSIFVFLKREITTLILGVSKSIGDSYRAAPPNMQRTAKRGLLGALILVLVIIGWKFGWNFYQARELRAEQERGPQVKVAKAETAATERVTKIMGEASPYASVTLYAKVSGYLKRLDVDKGDVVKAGQVLAVIESPHAKVTGAHAGFAAGGGTSALRRGCGEGAF